jgi:hypothetical protein
VRLAVALSCFVGGAATGVASVAVHAQWWGLLLALAATAANMVALPGGWWRRLPFAAGWFLAVAVLTPERPEGDYLIAGNAVGYVLLGAALAVLVSGMVGLRQAAGAQRRVHGAAEDSGVVRSAP